MMESVDLEVEELEVGGVIVDRRGQKWAVPAGNVEDLYDLYATASVHIPDPEENFTYQMLPEKEIAAAELRGWKKVLRSEVGVPQTDLDQYGKSVDSLHKVGDSVLMKIPTVIWKRFHDAKCRRARDELAGLEPSEEEKARAKASGISISVEQHKSIGGFTPGGDKTVEEVL